MGEYDELSSSMDAAESLEDDMVFSESALDAAETSYVNPIMDSVEMEPVAFEDEVSEQIEDSGIEAGEQIENDMDSGEILTPHEALDNMSDYMNRHNYGLEDYEVYSQDSEWQALNRDLQIANGIEPSEISGLPFEQDIETMEPRVFDDFEQSVLDNNPTFYETGQFYEQGINEFGYEGTCGPTSQANALNELLGTTDLTENKILEVAVDNHLCTTSGELEECGGMSTEQFMELYDKMNEQLGDRFETELFEFDNALNAEQVAARLEAGDVVNVAVDADALWNQPRNYVDDMGVRHDDFCSDHWITVTGVERSTGDVIDGFHIIDSGGGENYVSLDKYNEICYGTPAHRVIDPTCIVLSKKV